MFTDEQCDDLIEMINKYAIKGRETYGHHANVLADSVNLMEISDSEDQIKVRDIAFTKIMDICKIFKEEYDIDMGGFVTPTLRKITGATRQHKDGVILGKQVRDGKCPASELRNMALVMALNDDYEGGELCFPEQQRTFKLKKGQIIAFPPYWTHPHYTKDLEGGTVRYTLNSWMHERMPS